MLRHSPLDAEHRRLGAKLVDFGGWEMPLAYPSGTVSEHLTCRRDAVMFDVSHLGTVRVEGPDAFSCLQQTLTNDLARIEPGKAQYTHLLDDDASVLDDIIVWWVEATRFDVMPNAANTDRAIAAMGGIDVTADRAVIAVQGPNARRRASNVVPMARDVAHFGVATVEWHNVTITIAGTGYTGEDGIEISVPVSAATTLWAELLDAGVTPAGLGARDTLRLEAGLPLHGHELGKGITPLQAGLGWVVSWEKGPFIGRDALQEEREQGISRRLRGFVADGRQPPRGDSVVMIDDEAVGMVTSGNYSPILERGIGLGFLDPTIKLGARVEIEVRGRRLGAEVVRPPFVRKQH